MKDTTTTENKRKGRISYSFAKQGARRDRRRQEAEKRQFEHDKLSDAQKLTLAQSPKRRGESKREIARLTKLLGIIDKAPHPVVITPPTPAVKAKRTRKVAVTAV